MKNKSAMFALAAMAMASINVNAPEKRERPEKSPLPDIKPPTGTKQYFFNNQGEYSTEKMLKSDCVFICHAINDKNAIRKYKKWVKTENYNHER